MCKLNVVQPSINLAKGAHLSAIIGCDARDLLTSFMLRSRTADIDLCRSVPWLLPFMVGRPLKRLDEIVNTLPSDTLCYLDGFRESDHCLVPAPTVVPTEDLRHLSTKPTMRFGHLLSERLRLRR